MGFRWTCRAASIENSGMFFAAEAKAENDMREEKEEDAAVAPETRDDAGPVVSAAGVVCCFLRA